MENTFNAAVALAAAFVSRLRLTAEKLQASGLAFTVLPDVTTPTEREQRAGGTKGRKGDAKSASTARKDVTLNGTVPLLVDPRLANEPSRLVATIVAGILRVLYPDTTETTPEGKSKRVRNALYGSAILGSALKYDKGATVPAWYFAPDTAAAAWINENIASVPSADVDFSAYQIAPPEANRSEVYQCTGADAPHVPFLIRVSGLSAKLAAEHGTCFACGRTLTLKKSKKEAEAAPDAFVAAA